MNLHSSLSAPLCLSNLYFVHESNFSLFLNLFVGPQVWSPQFRLTWANGRRTMTCIEEGNLNVLDISARMKHRALQGYGMQVLLLSDTSKCEVIDWDSWIFGSFVLNRLVRGNYLNACETWLWQAISLFCFYSLAVTQSLILISFRVCSVQKFGFFFFVSFVQQF